MNGAGFIAAECPLCHKPGALLVHQCVRAPQKGDWSVCLQCGRVLRFMQSHTTDHHGELVSRLVLVNGEYALSGAHPADHIMLVSLLDQALSAMVQSGAQRGQA
jgi:hypothetical protein